MAHLKNKKVTITEPITTRDNMNRPITIWKPLPNGENIWAYFRSASEREFNLAVATEAKFEVIFEINWRSNISTGMLIQYKGKKYVINRMDGFEDNRDDLKIYASRIE